MATTKDLTVYKGKTFTQVIRWETLPFIYKNITAITQAAPARLTVANHGLVDSWRVMPESIKGMTQMNDVGWQQITVVDPNTLEFNAVNSMSFKPYTSGGVIKSYTATNLTGYTARMTIKDKVGGTEIISLTTVNSRIALDNVAKTITLTVSATDTTAITAKKGVFDLELVSAGGVVSGLLSGSVTFVEEVTT